MDLLSVHHTITVYCTDFKITAYVLAGIILVLSTLHLLVLLALLIHKYRKKPKDLKTVLFPVIKNFYKYLQVIVFVLALIFSILTIINTANNGRLERVTWHFGLFAIICGWIFLIHLCSKMPFIGEQAIVFLDIVWTFSKLTLFALLLVLAATIVLAMTFFDAQALVSCCTGIFMY